MCGMFVQGVRTTDDACTGDEKEPTETKATSLDRLEGSSTVASGVTLAPWFESELTVQAC
jgi:hypothetical protein